MKKTYEILYEDQDLVIINKSSGLRTTPDRFHKHLPNVYELLQREYGEEGIFLVHRLDKDTSGVLCLARNAEAHRHLSLQFQERKTEKYYQVLVEGRVLEPQGQIDAPIGKDPSVEGKVCIDRQGKASQTSYELLEQFRSYAWLSCRIYTGRMHQVRVHLAHIGYPPAVDPLYNNKQALFLSQIKKRGFRMGKYKGEERPLLQRVPLHASALRLEHPRSGEGLHIEAPLPKDLRAVLSQLRKWSALSDSEQLL